MGVLECTILRLAANQRVTHISQYNIRIKTSIRRSKKRASQSHSVVCLFLKEVEWISCEVEPDVVGNSLCVLMYVYFDYEVKGQFPKEQ